jgi:hypothetical protein
MIAPLTFVNSQRISNSLTKLLLLVCLVNPVCTQTVLGQTTQELAKVNGVYMELVPSARRNAFGNPIYSLRLWQGGQLVASYDAVSGRSHTQGRNRHVAGTQAPLPNGQYRVSRNTQPGAVPEVGGIFLPISPTFRTGRSQLGIHYDPSYEKNRKEDGTSGCIGLTNREDRDAVLRFVRQRRPQFLFVRI